MSADDFEAVAEQVFSWLRILDRSSYYDLLGLDESAGEEEVQQGFHRFSESFHPDRHRGQPQEIRDGVTRIFKRGAEAYNVLRNAKTRAAYNLALSQGKLRLHKSQASGLKETAQEGLESLCTTPGGKLRARQAERAISERKWGEAELLLNQAMTAEGPSVKLRQRYDELLAVAQKNL